MITDHVFRLLNSGAGDHGYRGTTRVQKGMCGYLAKCNKPRSEHISTIEFRARQRRAPAES